MHKSLFLSIILHFVGASCFAQITNYQFGFEPGTTIGAWNYFENGTNMTGATFVANPFPDSVNNSPTVAKFTAADDGTEWAGCESLYGTLGKWKFNGATPTTVSIDVYKTSFTPFFIKFTSTNPSGQGTTYVGNQIPSAINKWVTLKFVIDFSTALIATNNGTGGGGVDNADNNIGNNQFVMHADRDANRPMDRVVYFDNIRFTATKLADPILPLVPVAAPMVHAPTPPMRNTPDVVSIYSGAYANLSGTKIGKNWGEATIASDIVVDGDTTKRLLQFNYQGVVLAAPINLIGFEKLHLDIYKTDQAQIKLSIIHQGGGDITKLLNISQPGWNSFDLPLSSFSGLNLTKVFQLKLEGAPTQGNTTVYFDNMYFYKATTGLTKIEPSLLKIYPNPAETSCRLVLDPVLGQRGDVRVYSAFGQLVQTVSTSTGNVDFDVTEWTPGVYFLQVEAVNGQSQMMKLMVVNR
jgi:Secretion system C-terminal sorting domain